MTEQSTPDAESLPQQPVSDLYKLILADGLKLTSEGNEIVYKVVTLRDTNVADERQAEAASERAVMAGGGWKLLVSDSNFKHVLNMLHIESFHCDQTVIPKGIIDLAMYDKLSSRDLELIEQRIFLLTLAAEVRYGNITQAEFESAVSEVVKPLVSTPQPSGQAPTVGVASDLPESGPSLLTDFAGNNAKGEA